mgnify:CR=1 FL=1
MALLLSSCSNAGPATSEYCALAKPIYVSRADVLTDETARQIYAHNETWREICR